eukprot:COSAG01_NODE_40342_length_465_cov_0.505464_1_plen_29_part_01
MAVADHQQRHVGLLGRIRSASGSGGVVVE